MHITYTCRQCERPVRVEMDVAARELSCSACGLAMPIPPEAMEGARLQSCLVCGGHDLFVRKDFSQRWGVTIVVVGLLLSTAAWAMHWRYLTYAILFATALCDVVLYVMVGNVLQCYRCRAEYRGLEGLEQFEPFNLETYERFRQQALRMAQSRKA